MANRIKGITVEINGETTGLEKALKTVNTTIRTTQSQLKDVEKLLKLDPSNTELLFQKQKTLKESISATKEKLDALKTAEEQAKTQMESGDLGKDKYDALQREIIETEEELKRLSKEAVDANESLNKIDSVGKTLEDVGGKLTDTGKTLTTHVTAPIVGIGAAAVKTTADFDEQMSKVQAISGATGDDFDDLRDKAREMGAKTKFSASEAGEAFEYMAMAGWKTTDMLEGVEGIMNLAAASCENLGTTSDIVTDALTAFGLQAKDSGHFSDVLAAASSNANTNVSMLGESFKYAAPVAGALGINAEDTSIALGLMANAGIKASQAGTSLRTGLTNMAKPTKQMQTYMDRYNIALQENDDGSVNLRETMISLREKMNGLSETEQAAAVSAIFGKNSMAGWLAIINASNDDFNKLTGAIDSCSDTFVKTKDGAIIPMSEAMEKGISWVEEYNGVTEQMASTMQNNLSGQLTILKSQLEELAISFGNLLMPIIRKAVSAVQGLVDKLNQMSDSQRETILKLAAFAAAIGPVILVVGKITTGIGKSLQGIASFGRGILTLVSQVKLGVGIGGKLASMFSLLTGPVGIVIAIIGVLVAAFIHLWKTNEEFREKVTAIWERIKKVFSDFVSGIKKRLDALGIDFSTITETIKKIWNAFCDLLAPVFITAFEIIADVLETVLMVLTGLFDVFSGIFTGDWELVWTGVKEIFSSIWNGIRGIFSSVLKGLKNLADVFLGWFGTDWETVWTSVTTFFEETWNGIIDFFMNTWETIKTTISTAVSTVATILSTVWNTITETVHSIWDGITSAVSNAWETIKNVVQVGILFIGELFSAAFQILTLPFRFIWENCKDTVITIWNVIKETISNVLHAIQSVIESVWNAIASFLSPIVNAIKNTIEKAWKAISSTISTVMGVISTTLTIVWNAIKSVVTTVMNAISTVFTTIWNTIKTTITTVVNAIKTTVTTVWNAIKTAVTTVMNSIKSTITTIWNGIKTTVSTAVNGVKSTVTTAFNAVKSTAVSVWNSIKNAITTPINAAKDAVKSAIDKIKGFFNFSWSLPQLKLPHFSITGSFSLSPPSVPHLSIEWYKKAMDDGMIMNMPTIFGMKGNMLLAGGEVGSETIVGTESLMDMIRNAVAGIASGTTVNYGGVTINVYGKEGQDIEALADEIEERINNNVIRRRAAFV